MNTDVTRTDTPPPGETRSEDTLTDRTAPGVNLYGQGTRHWLVETDQDGSFVLPDELWASSMLAGHARFDYLAVGEGSFVLRACPHTLETYRAQPQGADGHRDDPQWTDGSYCGLTKWTCAGCGASTIVEHIDAFPAGWLEVNQLDRHLNTVAGAVVCSRACLASFAAGDAPLVAWHLPGFAPPVDHEPQSGLGT